MVTVGQPAPSFERLAHDGTIVQVGGPRERVLVLYFYPADETPGCTAQACRLRDSLEEFADAGAEVVGVSSDPVEKHVRFASGHGLPFPLVSDADGTLRQLYGARSWLGILPGRVTYVIDREGRVRHIFNSQLQIRKHVDEALRVVHELRGEFPTPAADEKTVGVE